MTAALQTTPAVPSGTAGVAVPVPVQRTVPVPVQRTVLGIDTDRTGTGDADHLIADLAAVLPAGTLACTHLVRRGDLLHGEDPHVSVSVDVPGQVDPAVVDQVGAAFGRRALVVELLADDDVRISDDAAAGGARLAVSEALTGSSGRAVLFPGSAALTGAVTVGEVLARSAVDRVVDLTGTDVDAAVTVRTRDFVRPRRVGRHLELTVQPARGGTVVPFEDPDPTPCCAVHAIPRDRP